MAADESYPEDLRYHREHDWARVDGDTATVGITWYAQDALGELVHFEPPEEGGMVTSGSLSPMLEQGIGLAYVGSGIAAPETKVTVDLRGRPRAAHIVKKPIYKREE